MRYTAIWTIAADGSYVMRERIVSSAIYRPFGPEILRVWIFLSILFFSQVTESTKSRTLTFSTVGRGHGDASIQEADMILPPHSGVAMLVIRDRVRVVSASFPRAKAKQQN